MRFGRFDPSKVLLLIRDRHVETFPALVDRLVDRHLSKSTHFHRRRELQRIVSQLESAGLVEIDQERLTATALVEKVQNALEISLTDLSRIEQGAIPVEPVFGATDPPQAISEIFVLMPFSEKLKPVYEDHIKKAAESARLSVSRADDFFAAESIISDIWRAIYNSRIIIADCTGRNPNVFYEIGIAHTVGRPTILISQSIEDVPFDLRHRRCILYEFTPRGMQAFTKALTVALDVEKQRRQRSGAEIE